MSHDIQVFNAHPRTRLRREPIAGSVNDVLRGEKVGLATINVVLVSDPELLRMNREHLGHDYLTDVITFVIDERPLEAEIYISVDRAREQAFDHGIGLYQEIQRLAIHGALHLAGYDDATDVERKRMHQLENHYLGIVDSFS